MTTCDVCGKTLEVGVWPWCPHGHPHLGIIPDSLSGGAQWIENLDTQPVWVESKSQLRAEAQARGLRWDPKPQPKNIRPFPADFDCRGRFNGGAFPTFKDTPDHGKPRDRDRHPREDQLPAATRRDE